MLKFYKFNNCHSEVYVFQNSYFKEVDTFIKALLLILGVMLQSRYLMLGTDYS